MSKGSAQRGTSKAERQRYRDGWDRAFAASTTRPPYLNVVGNPPPARKQESTAAPVRMSLHCPTCKCRHIDKGVWARRPHRTHLCAFCGGVWRPREYSTVGIATYDLKKKTQAKT